MPSSRVLLFNVTVAFILIRMQLGSDDNAIVKIINCYWDDFLQLQTESHERNQNTEHGSLDVVTHLTAELHFSAQRRADEDVWIQTTSFLYAN